MLHFTIVGPLDAKRRAYQEGAKDCALVASYLVYCSNLNGDMTNSITQLRRNRPELFREENHE